MRGDWENTSIYIKIRELARLKGFITARDLVNLGFKPKKAYYYLEELKKKKILIESFPVEGRRGETGRPKAYVWNIQFETELLKDVSQALSKWEKREINFSNWPSFLLRDGKVSLTIILGNSSRFYEKHPRVYPKLSDAVGLSELLSRPIFASYDSDIVTLLDDWALYSQLHRKRLSTTDILCIGSPKINLVAQKLNEYILFRFNYQLTPTTDFEFAQYPMYSISDPFVSGSCHIIGTGGAERHGLGVITMCRSPFSKTNYAIFVAGYRAFVGQVCLQILAGKDKWNCYKELPERPFGGVIEAEYEQENIKYSKEAGTITIFKVKDVRWLTPRYTMDQLRERVKEYPLMQEFLE